MTFYQSVLGGELELMTFGDMGMEGEHTNRVMHGALNGDDGDELRTWFAGLSEGDEFGQGADKFGVIWIVNIAGEPV